MWPVPDTTAAGGRTHWCNQSTEFQPASSHSSITVDSCHVKLSKSSQNRCRALSARWLRCTGMHPPQHKQACPAASTQAAGGIQQAGSTHSGLDCVVHQACPCQLTAAMGGCHPAHLLPPNAPPLRRALVCRQQQHPRHLQLQAPSLLLS
jgi:hypothetical protein